LGESHTLLFVGVLGGLAVVVVVVVIVVVVGGVVVVLEDVVCGVVMG
jgi:hypothetical protein